MNLVEKLKNSGFILILSIFTATLSGCESSYMKITGRKIKQVSQEKRLPRDNQEYIEYAGKDQLKSDNKRKVYTEDAGQFNDIFSQRRDMYPQRLSEYKETLKKIEFGEINNYSKEGRTSETIQIERFYSKLSPSSEGTQPSEEKKVKEKKPLESKNLEALAPQNSEDNVNNEYTQQLQDNLHKSKINVIDTSSLDAENKAKEEMKHRRHSKEALKTARIPVILETPEKVEVKVKDDTVLKQTKNILINNITTEKPDSILSKEVIIIEKPQRKKEEERWTEDETMLKPEDIRSYR